MPTYAPINSKVQHPPPGQPPGHLNFWRLACSNSLPSGQKSRSNAPPISTELPLLKGKFHLHSNTLHAFQREIRRNDTFILLLKTLLKELFTNKGEILSCKSVIPCKNRKNSRAYYVRTRDKSGSNSPLFRPNVQIPPYRGTMHSQMPAVCPGGGMLKFRIDRRISVLFVWVLRRSRDFRAGERSERARKSKPAWKPWIFNSAPGVVTSLHYSCVKCLTKTSEAKRK